MVVVALDFTTTDGMTEETISGQRDSKVEKSQVTDDRQGENPKTVIVFAKMADHEGSGDKHRCDLNGMITQADGRSAEEFFRQRHPDE